MKVVVFANYNKDMIKNVVTEMEAFFRSLKVECSCVSLTASVSDYNIKYPKCDLAISVGGDGTALTTSVILKNSNIPIMAVNCGTFGFITEIALSEYKQAFLQFLAGKSKYESRIMLDVKIKRTEQIVYNGTALNDVNIATTLVKLAKMNLYVDNTLAANLKADGLLVATPTGSTAYNLSAGGPVLDSGLRSFIINPICPFSMSVRPLVVSDSCEIRIAIPEQKANLILAVDGHEIINLEKDDEIVLCKSKNDALFVKSTCRSFIETVRDKLDWAKEFVNA